MDDDEIFSDSQNFYSTQNFNPSQTFNPSQDYIPSFDHFPNSSQFETNVNASNAPHGWNEQEDNALMSAWCFISANACVGTNRTSANLWENILVQYEQTRKENPTMGAQRSLESLRQRYRRLNANVSKWIAAYKRAHERATSGQSNEDIEKAAQQIYGKGKFTHHQPDDDSLEESRGSSKRSRTSEEGGPQINSTPGSVSSTLQRPIGRDKIKAKAKRKGKEVATPSYTVPNDFTAALREMRVTRERECDIQERKIK
ncbi:glutathione S-transferase T3-like, partial [Salvia hispanica]|uniref:glutathione S-transferase T3-like n=1 Tax=Salvia hispanica TaxID=49212 RepID=UPI00200959A5